MVQSTSFLRLFVLSLFISLSIVGSAHAQGCWLSAGTGGTGGRPTPFSGNSEIDQATQREGLALIGKFGVSPSGFFFAEGSGRNAYATSQVLSPNGPDGTIVMGLSLIRAELQRDGGAGLAVPAIMAHEFAHVVQFKRGSRMSVKEKELQADYLAGWYMGNRWIVTDTRSAFAAFFEMGDYQFNHPDHHGTPTQRLAAIQEGLRNSNQSLESAYVASAAFVRSL